MLQISDLTLRRGEKLLLQDASLTVHHGQRMGITGSNGAGKSSLFAMLRGQLDSDSGSCRIPPNYVVAHVAQETPALQQSALNYVLDGDNELKALQARLAECPEDTNALMQMEAIDGYTAPARAAKLLAGLGFSEEGMQQAVATFSGGWRMRLNLAQALMCRSDMLLLDEPTNHLDMDAILWLETWLKQYSGLLLLISHDRDFLDNVVQAIISFERQNLQLYTGNYSEFEKAKAERLAQHQQAYEKQQEEIAHIRGFIDRFGAKATKARQAQSRVKALERMELLGPAHVESGFHFSFPDPKRLPNPLLSLSRASIGYDTNQPIATNVNLTLLPGSRIGLLGPNGAGKSTLIKSLAEQLPLIAGERTEPQHLHVGYFAQHQLELLDENDTPMQIIQRMAPRMTEQEIRDFLGGYGFRGDMVVSKVAPFSGGERARLVLAMLAFEEPNLLLLDEPTNHLDLEMRYALSMALQAYEGAIVIVSHDRHLLKMCCDELYLVANGKAEPFADDMDGYAKWLMTQNKANADTDKAATGDNQSPSVSRQEQKRIAAERRQKMSPLKNRLKKLERIVEELTEKKQALEIQLGDGAMYEASNADQLAEVLKAQSDCKQQLDAAEEEWFEVNTELEELEAEV